MRMFGGNRLGWKNLTSVSQIGYRAFTDYDIIVLRSYHVLKVYNAFATCPQNSLLGSTKLVESC